MTSSAFPFMSTMSDTDSVIVQRLEDEEDSSSLSLPNPSQVPSPKSASVSEEDQFKEATRAAKQSGVTFSIWPPTQRTREAVINRLIETLSTSSVVSKRYGTMPLEEASAAAHLIEEEAFVAAGGACETEGDGVEILNLYSKEISKRMLQMVKARASAASAEENGASQKDDSSVISTTTNENISTVENES